MRSKSQCVLSMTVLVALLCGTACEATMECAVGESGCPCDSRGECSDGSRCVGGQCAEPTTRPLRVSAPEARACEVLLVDAGERFAGVRFGGGTVGTQVREAPRTAVTFSRPSDTPLGRADVQLELVGEGPPPEVRQSRCFGADGRELADVTVTVGG